MIKNVKEFFLPKTIKDAVKLLESGEGRSVILAGGTSFVLRPPKKAINIVSLRDLPLKKIQVGDKKVSIGSMVSLAELSKANQIKDYVGESLKEAAHRTATTSLRNLITIGGNLVQIYSWSNLAVIALTAKMTIVLTGRKTRRINARDFFLKHPTQILKPNEILTAIEYNLPASKNILTSAFAKFSLTQNDYSLLSAGIYLKIKERKIVDAGVAAGAISALPQVLSNVEKFLISKHIEDIDSLSAEVGKIASSQINPKPDFRVTGEYKIAIAKTIFEDTMKKALNKIKKLG